MTVVEFISDALYDMIKQSPTKSMNLQQLGQILDDNKVDVDLCYPIMHILIDIKGLYISDHVKDEDVRICI